MNRARLAAVRTTLAGKHPRVGSGCVIGPGLVLTAGHALQPLGAAVAADGVHVQVQFLTTNRLVPAEIAWDGRRYGLDAAVLRIAPDRRPAEVPDSPVRFGRFVTLRAGQPCDTVGFARVQGARRADGLETAQVSGTVSPGDGMLGGRWELSVDRAPAGLGESPWSGMSGSALWSGRLLCGVIGVDLAHWQHGKLQAVPAHRLLAEPSLRALLRSELGHVPVAEPVELDALCEPAVPARAPRLPSELLRPQAESVPFGGRERELRDFVDWCGDGGGLATRLITGLGGQGKTRFARELAVTMATRGWVTARLRESDTDRAELVRGLQALTEVDQRMLLVLDYAETSPDLVGNVLETLQARGGHHPVRVVLIARSAGEWWEQLPGATPRSAGVLSGARTVELREVATTAPDRERRYREAVGALARGLPALGTPAEAGRADWAGVARTVLARPYRDTGNGSALHLHMRALLDLLTAADQRAAARRARTRAEPDGGRPPADPDVRAELLGHERRYWRRTADSLPGPGLALGGSGQDSLADIVAVATLTSATRADRAVELLSLLPGAAGDRAPRAAAEWLHELYPPAEGSYWGALEPDLLGEYHVASRVRHHPGLLPALLPRLRGREAERALTVLARAEAQPGCPCPDLADRVERLIVDHPSALAVPAAVVAGRSENPGFLLGALRALAARSDLSPELLETLHAVVPGGSRLLGEQALGLAERLARMHRRRAWLTGGEPRLSSPRVRADVARAEHNLAVRLVSVRRWTEAVESSGRAIRLYRGLSRARPATYLPLLAESLGVRWAALSELGRYREALTDCAEAVRVNRRLVADGPAGPAAPGDPERDGTEPAGGRTAGGPGAGRAPVPYRGAADRPGPVPARVPAAAGAAAALVAEAAALVGPEPGPRGAAAVPGRTAALDTEAMTHRARLAQALNNLSVVLAARDFREEALAAAEEAVEISEELVHLRPVRHHLALLAGALHNLANRLSPGRSALETVTHAVLIRRRLAQVHPDAYLPGLMESLHNQALELAALGRYSAARRVIDEALRVTLQLVEDQPALYRPALPRVLRTRAGVLNRTGDGFEAARSAFRALLLYRDLARTAPARYHEDIEAALRQAASVAWDAFENVDRRRGALWWGGLRGEASRLAAERAAREYRERLRDTRWPRARARLAQWAGVRLRVERPREPVRSGRPASLPVVRVTVPTVLQVPREDEMARDRRAFRALLGPGDLIRSPPPGVPRPPAPVGLAWALELNPELEELLEPLGPLVYEGEELNSALRQLLKPLEHLAREAGPVPDAEASGAPAPDGCEEVT
ncbi:serine protease [Streptomyces ziwulingensis]|uniref:Tetratricopeptide repeat protein n=1 Tax=Streptomyces ziwulingensis TaxID=1045501 RepID=A0ABP9D4X6_9ACTN